MAASKYKLIVSLFAVYKHKLWHFVCVWVCIIVTLKQINTVQWFIHPEIKKKETTIGFDETLHVVCACVYYCYIEVN